MTLAIVIFFIGYIFSLAGSFYFSGTEAGFLSLNKHKHQGNVQAMHLGAIRLNSYVERPEKVLGLTLFGNNLANVAAPTLAINLCFAFFQFHPQYKGVEFIFLIATNILLFMFGEVLPKIFFKTYANEILYRTVGVLRLFDLLFKPLIKVITFISDLLLAPLRLKSKTIQRINRHDFNHLIFDSIEDGLVNEDERYFLSTIASLSSMKAVEVMIPLADLALLNRQQQITSIIEELKEQKHDIVPVYEGRIDHLIGYINIIDVFNSSSKKKLAKDYLIETSYVPETNTMDKIYLKLAKENNKVLIVVDEYGGCSGIITEELVINRIFGFSYSLGRQKQSDMISRLEDHLFEVDTHFDIDDLNERFGLKLPKQGYETLGGFLHHQSGGVPQKGETIRWGNVEWVVTEARKTGVDKVSMRFLKKKNLQKGDDRVHERVANGPEKLTEETHGKKEEYQSQKKN